MVEAKWARFRLLAFDVESTGIDVFTDRIVTASLTEVTPGRRPAHTRYVVDPGVEIPAEATAVHGFSRERAAAEATHTPDQMLFEITGRIALWLGHRQPLVAFNAAYDLSILEAENDRHGIDGLRARLGATRIAPVIDPLVIDKHADRYRKGGRKLTDMCDHYRVVHTGAHDATADGLAAARLFPRIIAAHADHFRGYDLGALHRDQIGWRREQADNLRAYFDKNGIDHDGVDTGWPLHSDLLTKKAAA